MRTSNYWFLSLMAIVFLFARNGIAETDLLNLSAYEEGDFPPYGENVVVAQSEQTGVKWITGIKTDINVSGQLKFSVNLSGDFEVFFEEAYWIELLLIAEEYKIRINGLDLYAAMNMRAKIKAICRRLVVKKRLGNFLSKITLPSFTLMISSLKKSP